jgi:hypothetical protein
MTKRSLLFALPCLALTACPTPPPTGGDRAPFVDEWELVDEGPADALTKLSIGGRISSDNFANRGDVEVIYDPSATTVKVEMQRFTIASNADSADEAFGRMSYWGYNASTPGPRDPMNAEDAALRCFLPENDACYIRNYYDGMSQPIRDGVNFRVTIPAGWDGDLEITTSDNLGEGIETYPDRSDVSVDGLAGTLAVDLDSGNLEIRVDPNVDHYAGCSANDACETGDPSADPPVGPFDSACGCADPTFINIENGPGQASNITIDVPTTSHVTEAGRWYDVRLENTGDFSSSADFSCTATIRCEDFGAGCVINPDFAGPNVENKEWAEINYPGDPAIPGTGIQVNATSQGCANITYLEDPLDYDLDTWPEEKRGDLLVCSGCL